MARRFDSKQLSCKTQEDSRNDLLDEGHIVGHWDAFETEPGHKCSLYKLDDDKFVD